MFTELKVQGWRCLKDVTLALTPLHALIGPNDSGKSTLLEALALAQGLQRPREESQPRFWLRGTDLDVKLLPGFDPEVLVNGRPTMDGEVSRRLGSSRRLRLDADALRRPSPLLTDELAEITERGDRLAGVYDAILGRNREAWDIIETSVLAGFPTVKRLLLRNVSQSSKALAIELHDGTVVPAEQMSEGLLYWLAYASLPHVSPIKLLLIEEPENGLHPARIREVVQVLRRVVASGTQVVLATHSPLLVNELQPEEVSVVTRTVEAGTRVRRVDSLPNLDRLLSAFSLGELWLAFADGKEEAGLFEPPPAPEPG